MIKNKIKISKIIIENNLFKIISDNNIEFISKIHKGSVNFKIYNEDNQEVNISNINEGDKIKIYTNKKINLTNEDKLVNILNNINNNNIKNNIISKILIKNKYEFNSDSSNDYNDF